MFTIVCSRLETPEKSYKTRASNVPLLTSEVLPVEAGNMGHSEAGLQDLGHLQGLDLALQIVATLVT